MIHSRKEPNAVYITEALRMAIFALNKQEPKKPIHIHEEHSEHLWKRNADGTIDTSAMSSGFCNGPYCTRCHHSECEHCNPNWETNPEEPCVVDKDVCPTCGKDLDYWNQGNYCYECGQTLDWSELVL
jgi:hypothetical protein